MEEVTFIKNVIFDRKVRKPGDKPLMVSEGEAENLRRIGVVAEKGSEAADTPETETEPEPTEPKEAPAVEEQAETADPEPKLEPEPASQMPKPLPEKAPKTKRKYSMKKKK